MSFPSGLRREHRCLRRGTAILLAYRGSIAHGTYEPSSEPGSIDDKDAIGVAVPGLDHYIGQRRFGSRGTVEIVSDPWDIVVYEARKAIHLLAKGNPNVLALLWLERPFYIDLTPPGERLIEARSLFATRSTFQSFVGYARGQLQRLDVSDGKPLRGLAYLAGIFDGEGHVSIGRVEGLKSTHSPVHSLTVGITNTDRDLIERLTKMYGGYVGRTGVRGQHRTDAYRWRLDAGAAASFLRDLHPFLMIKKRQAEIGIEFQHELATRPRGRLTEYELDRREELRQALRNTREDKTLPVPEPERGAPTGPERYATAYMGEKRKRLVAQHGYDTKNAAHLIRLLRMGVEFLGDGQLRVRRPDAPELLAIKHGEWTLEQVKLEAERLFRDAEDAHAASTLPDKPDPDAINALTVAVIGEALGLR